MSGAGSCRSGRAAGPSASVIVVGPGANRMGHPRVCVRAGAAAGACSRSVRTAGAPPRETWDCLSGKSKRGKSQRPDSSKERSWEGLRQRAKAHLFGLREPRRSSVSNGTDWSRLYGWRWGCRDAMGLSRCDGGALPGTGETRAVCDSLCRCASTHLGSSSGLYGLLYAIVALVGWSRLSTHEIVAGGFS